MKFKLGDIVQPEGRQAGIIVETEFENPNTMDYGGKKYYAEYGIADGDSEYIWWYSGKLLKKLSGGIKGNANLGIFVKNMLQQKDRVNEEYNRDLHMSTGAYKNV